METKICTKCGEEKPLDEYYKGDRKYGRRPVCKKCESVRAKKYYKINSDKLKEYCRKYRKENREKVLEADRERNRIHRLNLTSTDKEKIKKYNAQYGLDNKDKILIKRKIYRDSRTDAEKGKIKEYHKKLWENNKERYRLRNKAYCVDLRDGYVRYALRRSGVPNELITLELIKQRRTIIQIHRLIQQIKQNGSKKS